MRRFISKLVCPFSVRFSKSSTPDPTADLARTYDGSPQAATIPKCPLSVLVPERLRVVDVGDSPQHNVPLENLPPEIRCEIVAVLGLEELGALVHASPVFHRQYLLDRRSLLCMCLDTTLRGAALDAYAVYQSSSFDFAQKRTGDGVREFLEPYRDRHFSAQYSICTECTEELTEDDAIHLAAFYFSTIKPPAYCYTRWTLANLANESKELQSYGLLSKTEETRVLRALYRFQLFCNLFGAGFYKPFGRSSLWLSSVEILRIFICIFEPWEVEEIVCIYAFIKEKYDQIFYDIRWDVHEENPKFEGQWPPTPDGAFDLDDSYNRKVLLSGTISHGLELLHMIIFTVTDRAQLVSVMQKNISLVGGRFFEGEVLGDTAQAMRRSEQLLDKDQKQERRDPFPFNGDCGPDFNGPYPPLAWTLIWKGTYSNIYGYCIGDNIRRWGYVMWDATRLERTGAKEVLMRQWEAEWDDYDPRDNFY